MSEPLICGFMGTCDRPELLGRAIRCYERQTYNNRFLVILDDLGQYQNDRGDRWELVSTLRRFSSLGEKSNAAIALAPRNVFGLVKMDDDDFYSPWHFEAAAAALETSQVCQPRHVMDFVDGRWAVTETFNRKRPDYFAYHGSWSYRRELFVKMRGYAAEYAGDDGELQRRLLEAKISSADTPEKYRPSYWYNRPLPGRISERGGSEQAYWDSAPKEIKYVGTVPKWKSEEDWLRPIPTEVIARPW